MLGFNPTTSPPLTLISNPIHQPYRGHNLPQLFPFLLRHALPILITNLPIDQLSQSSFHPQPIRKSLIVHLKTIIKPQRIPFFRLAWGRRQRQRFQKRNVVLAQCSCPEVLDSDNLRLN